MNPRGGIRYRLSALCRMSRGRFISYKSIAVSSVSTVSLLHEASPVVVGGLELSNQGKILSCGSITIKMAQLEDEWDAAPLWRYSYKTGETGASNSADPAPRSIPLAERLSVALQPPLSLCLSSSGSLMWPDKLLDFQKDGIQALVERASILLADEMGLGKTIQAIAAMRLLAIREKLERALVVVPAAVLRNWRDEIGKWAPELRSIEITGSQPQRNWKWDARVHIKIVSYETLRSDYMLAVRHGEWDIVCLDEAQRIKNSGSAISGVVKGIRSKRRWALTGTPLENSLEDVRSILSFLHPVNSNGQKTGETSIGDIKLALGTVQLRRKKSEVLADLPPKTITEFFVQLSRQQRKEYDALFSGGVCDLRSMGVDATVTDVLALITRLKQVCNFSTSGGCSSKLNDIAPRLYALRSEGHKALVFSQFTNESYGVRKIAHALKSFNPVIYTGDMTANQRLDAIKVFRDDTDAGVLILSLKAGGVGLNLQQASYVFHFDRWWNPASEAQADDRSHRFGQTCGVSVYKYICENTIEERIHEILQAKRALFAEYVDDVCIDLGQRLTEEELFGLFGLEPPSRPANSVSEKRRSIIMPDSELHSLVKHQLACIGYRTGIMYPSCEHGTDIVADRTDELGIEITLLVRCVNRQSPVEYEAVLEFCELLTEDRTSFGGLIACLAGFSSEAITLAKRYNILLWSEAEINP